MPAPEIKNRDAFRDYAIEDTFEAGIVLSGPEVKSIRLGQASWTGGYAAVERNKVFVYGLHIDPYKFDTSHSRAGKIADTTLVAHEPTRPRLLLLKAKEIAELQAATQAEGYTLVPLKLYFKKALIKIALGLGRGKKKFDKRAEMKAKAVSRETERYFKKY